MKPRDYPIQACTTSFTGPPITLQEEAIFKAYLNEKRFLHLQLQNKKKK